MKKSTLLLLLLPAYLFTIAQTTLVSYGSTWKFKDNGSDQGTAWRATSFNDAAWASGPAELGYGDGDEATVVSYGPNANKKYITTYFRQTFPVTNASSFTSFTLNLMRDDGAVVFINGVEKFRSNMTSGNINYKTKALADAADEGNTAQTITLPAGSLVTGSNVIAVEIHQSAQNSSDISFDLELIGNTTPVTAVLTRGPYLNMGNETAVTLRWRTNIATDSKIEVGTVHGTYTLAATNPAITTEHEVRISGLTNDTKYFYRFGSSTQTLQSSVDNYFISSPPAQTTRKIRIAAYGDCGRNDNGYQAGTLNAYLNYTGANPAELMLLLGDNAYDNGLDNEYQTRFFNSYSGNILRNHQLFPAPGNHDYANSSTRQADHNIPYYSIFTNPTAAECGGLASGTEAYYSWNWGNVHFLSLDSYGKENGGVTRLYDTTGAQATWVKQDLAANTLPWVIAYWHHPPYTMGSHNSDTETELINMRQNFIRILERNGVDLIICGHSHDYERSYLLKGYYSNELSFNPAIHTLSNSTAKYDGTTNSCPYYTENGPNHGTVYVVAGSAGASGGVQSGYPHNAMPFSMNDGGMLYFEIEDNRLDAKFIRQSGMIDDKFTIMKNVNRTTNLTITTGTSAQLTASWTGNYSWSTSESTKTITVSPTSNTSYTVTDNLSCLNDVFNITVEGGVAKNPVINLTPEIQPIMAWQVYPTLVKKGQQVTVETGGNEAMELILLDLSGKTIKTLKFTNRLSVQTKDLIAGTYILKINSHKNYKARQVVVVE